MSKIEAIIQLHCTGKTDSKIIKLLKVAKSTVYHFLKTFKQLCTSEDCHGGGRLCTDQSKKLVIAVITAQKSVRERVIRNPKRSARQMDKTESECDLNQKHHQK